MKILLLLVAAILLPACRSEPEAPRLLRLQVDQLNAVDAAGSGLTLDSVERTIEAGHIARDVRPVFAVSVSIGRIMQVFNLLQWAGVDAGELHIGFNIAGREEKPDFLLSLPPLEVCCYPDFDEEPVADDWGSAQIVGYYYGHSRCIEYELA